MKRRIVLLGPPASGKGTQADLIGQRLNIPSASPGAMLREQKAAGTSLGLEADRLTAKGHLLPDEIILALVRVWLEKNTESFVFDGFPRTLGQAEGLDAMLTRMGSGLDLVVGLQLPRAVIEKRVANRRMCIACRLIVSVGLHVDADTDPCPRCGEPLSVRSDDNLEALEQRMAEYREKTEPVLGYYRAKGSLIEVDASREAEVVFGEIRNLLQAA